ncbi:MAG TPA: glycosyltransferase [Gemmatimonadaceae bacterium]|nr:glycosyltransferase [Gemmatimonadaceae bacterium]
MRILWLSHFVPYPPSGGALQRTFHLLRHAAERHEVHLLALNQPRLLSTPAAVQDATDALAKLCASVRVIPIPAERSRLHRMFAAARAVLGPDPFDVVWLRNTEFRDAAIERLTMSVDLVHVDTIGLWPVVDTCRRSPIVLGHHNIESELILRRAAHETGWRARILTRDASKLRKLEQRASARAAMNVVVSSLDGGRLESIAPGAGVEVVDNGVDTEYWRPTTTSAENNGIIFAGTLGWYPNRDAVEFLVSQIWPLLSSSNQGRRLFLVGRDPPEMARQAAETDPRIQVTGFVPDVRPYMRDAAIALCPIRVGGGTRLKILDALAMAKPLVSTAVGIEGLDLIEGKHYLRAESAAEFVDQIRLLESDSDLRRQLGAAGRQAVVERYDWSVIGRQLDSAYARAVSGASQIESR